MQHLQNVSSHYLSQKKKKNLPKQRKNHRDGPQTSFVFPHFLTLLKPTLENIYEAIRCQLVALFHPQTQNIKKS